MWTAWPAAENGPDRAVYTSITVSKLKIEFDYQEISLRQLQGLFPKISDLTFDLRDRAIDERDFGLLEQVWECWPRLEKLNFGYSEWAQSLMHEEVTPLGRNCDAAFLGIHEEEAVLLRRQDEEYLRDVHIVPLRPSLLTMPSKRSSCETLLLNFF